MKLIDNWQRAWRLSSVRAALLLLALSMLQGLQADVLPLLQGVVKPEHWPWVSASFAAAIVVLRVLRQVAALDPTEVEPADTSGASEQGPSS